MKTVVAFCRKHFDRFDNRKALQKTGYNPDTISRIKLMRNTDPEQNLGLVKLAFCKERDHIGGVAYLASLTEGLPRRPVIEEYIRIVKEKAKLRRIIFVCSEAIMHAEEQSTTASDIVEQLGIGVRGIKEKRKP